MVVCPHLVGRLGLAALQVLFVQRRKIDGLRVLADIEKPAVAAFDDVEAVALKAPVGVPSATYIAGTPDRHAQIVGRDNASMIRS